MDPNVRVAIHEAAHALVGVQLAVLVDSAEVDGPRGAVYYRRRRLLADDLEREIALCLAGRIAEAIVDRRDWRRPESLRASLDLEAEDLVDQADDDLLLAAGDRAFEILEAGWERVRSLAALLLVDSTIDYRAALAA